MNLEYVPLLAIQRGLQGIPRSRARFRQYLRTIFTPENMIERLPLLAANPMAKDHVTALLDNLLALGADGIAARETAVASTELLDVPGDFNVALVVLDDLMGGWTNRYAEEFTLRFRCGPLLKLPRFLKRFWIYGVLWSSEPAGERTVREAMRTALYRIAYVQCHGGARTLRDMMVQEGTVRAQAGCTTPMLDDDDIAYTRAVLTPDLDATDMRTCIECLFGDAAGRTLGFTPRGLSPWAGLALALHDARNTDRSAQHTHAERQ